MAGGFSFAPCRLIIERLQDLAIATHLAPLPQQADPDG